MFVVFILLLATSGKVHGFASTEKTALAKTVEACRGVIGRRDALLKTVAASVTATLAPPPSKALTPTEAEIQYDVYAASYDQLDGGKASSILGIEEARRSLIQKARGKVLEIGVGTGLNLDKYLEQSISSLTLVDISDGMLQEARVKVNSLPNLQNVEVNLIKADATTELVDRFGPESFDTVIDSFSFCVLGNEGARRCLDQLSRVVKRGENGGQLLLLENSRSSNALFGLYQDATADIAATAGGKGCIYNQDVESLIRATGRIRIVDETEYAAGLFRSFQCVRN
jgi:methyltransferase OMS1, mitochondrial